MPVINQAAASPRVISITDITQEARRNVEICNSCRYCEGYCAVFPAIQRQREFSDKDLDYLANLCHHCTSCYHACQFTTPHVYDINVPRILSQVRARSYEQYVWPGAMAGVLRRNGSFVLFVSALWLTLVLMVALAWIRPDALWQSHVGPGAFYQLIPHGWMAGLAGAVAVFDVLAIFLGFTAYWRAIGGKWRYFLNGPALRQTAKDVLSLRYLGGGADNQGCNNDSTRFSLARRWCHHLMAYGFLLCFGATAAGTVYDYGFGLVAPYAYFSLPVVLGTVGGLTGLVGTAGLVWLKLKMHDGPAWKAMFGMDYAFLLLLFWVNFTGLALLALRETTAMGILLLVHLGFVAAFFAILPYSKFIHVFFRIGALLKFNYERLQA